MAQISSRATVPPLIFSAAILCILAEIEFGSGSGVELNNSTRYRALLTDGIIIEKPEDRELKLNLPCGLKISNGCRKGRFEAGSSISSENQIRAKSQTRYINGRKEQTIRFSQSSVISSRSQKLELGSVIIAGNSTILSPNHTFELGFFSSDGGSNWYIGIWYFSIPIKTYVWVANRKSPVKNLTSSVMRLTEDGKLMISDSGDRNIWWTESVEAAVSAQLLETGNLVLLSRKGTTVWQSFDFPADTWLPGMNITSHISIECWRSESDPSPGNYSLRLKPPEYGEFELVFNGSKSYWSTGKWTGNSFTNVPQMLVRYIYSFHFEHPFTAAASFMYTVISQDNSSRPPLTRFTIDSSGELKQFTWSTQMENWNMFWFQPDNCCSVYGLCGNLGFCSTGTQRPCECLAGFTPSDKHAWNSGDFSGGCRHEDDYLCDESNVFEEVGTVAFDDATGVMFSGSRSRSFCESSCLKNCSCIGITHNAETGLYRNVYGNILNLRNLTYGSTTGEVVLYIRAGKLGSTQKKSKLTMAALIGGICGLVAAVAMTVLALLVLQKRRNRTKEKEAVLVTNLKVFSYKELSAATRGFSEKLGHGGFGTVFRGELPDSLPIAVKRLERPGGGEKEFRAEVCTIGNIQHVNLVRLRGFCSENSHRLLVYDYMPNGPLSVFLRRDGQSLGWDVRFRVAVGTAKGIAYLHEECRDCIIHCDIKPENILLDSDFSAKVSDFGLAKLIGRDFSRVLTTMRGTWGYVAPEWISGVAITAKADVYSYGMTLLEIIGGRRNVEKPHSPGREGVTEEKWFFPPWAARQIIEGNVAGVVDERLAGAYDSVEVERLALVAVWCIQDEEDARPTMSMVVKMLEGTVEVTVPPPPQLLQALISGDSFHGVGVSGLKPSSGAGANSD
ncbi:G-type lectin S-receptor-like serine/threonine-protein kinase SD2-2 [Macadamia integrifolia]|uniref:G-type lectin S-receptor-like serine/threonine-protein kinase SD2-2 n=1 Tax=Macadamia integrifolia TaxID=60698 RepID=UPI001C52CECB|nr:G-type lectin S-receptor-like serine/threonine-protein kinase SD2-2 [Macadamia integrifolia]